MDLFSIDKPKLELKPPIKLFEAFAGIGTQVMALNRLSNDVKVVGISEIDKYAIQSYMSIHGETKNYGDITKINGKDLPKIDILTWSFPCTDLSKAGKQKGLVDTRSGLGYQIPRIIGEMDVKPQVLLMENVSDLLSPKFRDGWHELYNTIEELGYTNYVQTLNAKHYGVAQNRDRVFMVSILGNHQFEFPKKVDLKLRLKDYLETFVDPKYYLSEKLVSYFHKHTQKHMEKGNGFKFEIKDKNGVAYAVTSKSGQRLGDNYINDKPIRMGGIYGKKQAGSVYDHDGLSPALTTESSNNWNVLLGEKNILIPEATKRGYALAEDGDGVYLNRPHQKRGVVQKGMIQTIKTSGDDLGVVQDMRIRKLTPKECWRLMDISDEDFQKAQAVCSDTQLYKQAGNAVVVSVYEAILRQLIE